MKKLVALFALGISTQFNLAGANVVEFTNQDLAGLASAGLVDVQGNLIDWKVGDRMDYNVSFGSFGNIGNSVKKVTSDEGTAIWVMQNVTAMGKNEVVEVLINKADAKILKMKRNGQDQQIPDDKLEIIEQDYTTVTVPAGKFDVMHIVGKTKEVERLEVWINPVKTTMDGTVKQNIKMSLGEISMELTKFNRVN